MLSWLNEVPRTELRARRLIWLNNNELAHHAAIFMFQDMTVIHKWYSGVSIGGKLGDKSHGFVRIYKHGIFPARLACCGWDAIAI